MISGMNVFGDQSFNFAIQSAFWFLLGLVIYCYVGYPVILLAVRLIHCKKSTRAEIVPSVAVFIAAYNEEKNIGKKLEAVLHQDYPAGKLKIFIGSDGSTDGTDDIVREYSLGSPYTITLVRNETNQGKNTLYNKIYPMTDAEILLLSDATSVWPKNLISKVVENFNDPQVGVVGVKLEYIEPGQDVDKISEQSMVRGQQKYWEYETFIRKLESDISTLIGVSGATFAVRRKVYRPVDPALQEDFIIPLSAIQQGFRVVFEDRTCVYEETSRSKKDEFGMRVRVATRAFFSIWHMKKLLNPLIFPAVSWQIFSHKILRLMTPFPLIALYFVNILLISLSPLFALFFIGQTVFYGMALASPLLQRLDFKILLLPYYFCLGNIAYFFAFFRFIRGEKYLKWNTVR
jgi:cellulose synthase/poly-beta-1,6-N-acetylglucosamine synthase-like glycosyltransferase